MKKVIESPKVKVIRFKAVDMIATSNNLNASADDWQYEDARSSFSSSSRE